MAKQILSAVAGAAALVGAAILAFCLICRRREETN